MKTVQTLAILLAFAMALCGLRYAAAGATSCGYVSWIKCPGCTDYTPPGGCYCGPNTQEERCDCLKSGGGIQYGILVECWHGPFDWVYDPDGNEISWGDQLPCSDLAKCMRQNGSQTNCGTYDSGRCLQLPGSCAWRVWNRTFAFTLVEGDPCQE